MPSTGGVLNILNLSQKWKVDFTLPRSQKENRAASVSNPPGFTPGAVQVADSGARDGDKHLLSKRAWDIALGPLKQLPMNLFIMYMAGNSISIFPIMMVGMMLVRPVKALLSTNSIFRGLNDSNKSALIGEKMVFVLGNLLGVAVALYKCSAMGLLPTHQSDWLAFATMPERMEYMVGGMTFDC
ncbi:unnamed protein product [Soboliphyme baturini]|uniref:ER membrane protein complex subunit 4 n=1 Tax=Soboliphyme baturini TaxID=241478 RepID=A0A183J6E0_9BILA|nr:unnamed protein product [Soboliphyme baturini]